eukprot:4841153-Amphidinium_carterae.6
MAKRQRRMMSTTTTETITMLTSRMTLPNYCSTPGNCYDFSYHWEDYATIGEEDQYRGQYVSCNDTNKT